MTEVITVCFASYNNYLVTLHITVCFALVITVDYNLKQKRKRGEEVTAIGGFKIAHFVEKKQAMINDKADKL